MARINYGNSIPSEKKKTKQGDGTYTKKPAPGGETFYGNRRSGSPPSPSRRRRKPSRGQGR